MTVPLPNQIPHASKSVSPSPEKLQDGPSVPRSSKAPSSRGTSGNTDRSHPNTTHTIREGGENEATRDPYICSCGVSFVSENDSYRHVKASKPTFVRPDHLNDRPLRGHEGLQALKQSLEGERKRPQNNRRQPRRAK